MIYFCFVADEDQKCVSWDNQIFFETTKLFRNETLEPPLVSGEDFSKRLTTELVFFFVAVTFAPQLQKREYTDDTGTFFLVHTGTAQFQKSAFLKREKLEKTKETF